MQGNLPSAFCKLLEQVRPRQGRLTCRWQRVPEVIQVKPIHETLVIVIYSFMVLSLVYVCIPKLDAKGWTILAETCFG